MSDRIKYNDRAGNIEKLLFYILSYLQKKALKFKSFIFFIKLRCYCSLVPHFSNITFSDMYNCHSESTLFRMSASGTIAFFAS